MKKALAGLLFASTLFCAMAHSATPEEEDAPGDNTGTAPSFSAIKADILEVNCTMCHQSLPPGHHIIIDVPRPLINYEDVMSVVKAGDAEHSPIYIAVTVGNMPRRGPKLSDAQIGELKAWIDAGAKND